MNSLSLAEITLTSCSTIISLILSLIGTIPTPSVPNLYCDSIVPLLLNNIVSSGKIETAPALFNTSFKTPSFSSHSPQFISRLLNEYIGFAKLIFIVSILITNIFQVI